MARVWVYQCVQLKLLVDVLLKNQSTLSRYVVKVKLIWWLRTVEDHSTQKKGEQLIDIDKGAQYQEEFLPDFTSLNNLHFVI